jgi:hypothetical protein
LNLKQRINRLKRQVTLEDERPQVTAILNSPEAVRLGFDLTSRMALVGTELFEAAEEEPTLAFHNRLVEVARARGAFVIALGSDEPVKESIFNADDSRRLLN